MVFASRSDQHGQTPVGPPHSKPVQYAVAESQSSLRSQSSSFDDSNSSKSPPNRPARMDTSRMSKPRLPTRDVTPSTSLSNPSSQEPPLDEDASKSLHSRSPPNAGYSQLQSRPTQSDLPTPKPWRGQPKAIGDSPYKRMANGELKHPPASPSPNANSSKLGHLQKPNATSSDTHMTELSNELRTRLSYAMVKVQHGWQSQSIDELENLPPRASPISASSKTHHSHPSPRVDTPNPRPERNTPGHLSAYSSPTSDYSPSSLHSHQRAAAKGKPSPRSSHSLLSSLQSEPSHASRASPHHHSPGADSKFPQSPTHFQQGPSLAPPATILPRSHRQSAMAKSPLSLNTKHSKNRSGFTQSSSKTSHSTALPATPTRTASHNAAMEKDAVETLLFMSSPKNVDSRPGSKSLSTPVRDGFASPEKRVGFSSGRHGYDNDSGYRHAPYGGYGAYGDGTSKVNRITSEADVDRYLDEMGDADSSSSDDVGLIKRH